MSGHQLPSISRDRLQDVGDLGVEAVFGVIYPPQVALVGFGRITARPWLAGPTLQSMPLLCATLAADHRVSDGHQGARFLAELRELLQRPQALDPAAGAPSLLKLRPQRSTTCSHCAIRSTWTPWIGSIS